MPLSDLDKPAELTVQQPAETQGQCVELAVDASDLQAQINALQDEVCLRAERNVWLAAAQAVGRALA